MSEADLQAQVADYLRLRYPDVLFHSNFRRDTWPNVFIAKAGTWYVRKGKRFPLGGKYIPVSSDGSFWRNYKFSGLFLELKKEGTKLKGKDGGWSSEYIDEQAGLLLRLRERGYCAEFAVGLDEAKKIIDKYLGGVK